MSDLHIIRKVQLFYPSLTEGSTSPFSPDDKSPRIEYGAGITTEAFEHRPSYKRAVLDRLSDSYFYSFRSPRKPIILTDDVMKLAQVRFMCNSTNISFDRLFCVVTSDVKFVNFDVNRNGERYRTASIESIYVKASHLKRAFEDQFKTLKAEFE